MRPQLYPTEAFRAFFSTFLAYPLLQLRGFFRAFRLQY